MRSIDLIKWNFINQDTPFLRIVLFHQDLYDGGFAAASDSSNGVELKLLKLKGKTIQNNFLSVKGVGKDDIAEDNLSYRLRFIYLLLFYDFWLFYELIDPSWTKDGRFDGGIIRAELQEVENAKESLEEDCEELVETIARSCDWDRAEIGSLDALESHDESNANQNIENKVEKTGWKAKLLSKLMQLILPTE